MASPPDGLMATFDGEAFHAPAPAAGPEQVTLRVDCGETGPGRLAITRDGEVWRQGDAHERLCEAPEGWARLKLKGRHPYEYGGQLCWHAGLQAMVLTGGKKSWNKAANATHVLDGDAMDFVIWLAAHPRRLPLSEHAGVALFICGSDDDCETWEDDGGGNAALLLKRSRKRRLPKPPAGAGPALKKRSLVYKEVFEPDPAREDVEPKMANRVGGYAAWLQDEETCRCPTCNKPMGFVAELSAALDARLNFGDAGEGYLFVCPDEHAAAFL